MVTAVTASCATSRSGVTMSRCISVGRVISAMALHSSGDGVIDSRTLIRSLCSSSAQSRNRPITQSFLGGRLEFLCFLEGFLDGAHHVERLFGDGVVLAVHKFLESPDGVFQLHVAAFHARELLGHKEGLRKEALNPPRPPHRELVL